MTPSLAALLAVALPALSALVLAVVWPLRRSVAAFTTISIGAAAASLVASVYALLMTGAPAQGISVPWLLTPVIHSSRQASTSTAYPP